MILENTKLFLKLYYRPLSAMSNIIDRGQWLFSAAAVVLISIFLQGVITSRIYYNFQAVPYTVQIPRPTPRPAPVTNQPTAPATTDDDDDPPYPQSYQFFRSEPLPFLGQFGWWFFNFMPISVYGSLVTLAFLYVPGTILVMISLEHLGSFGVILRRDYGPLLACTLMAWAASHLPFGLAGLAIDSFTIQTQNTVGPWLLHFTGMTLNLAKLGATLAFLLWILSTLYFAFLMVCAVRTIFGVSFGKAIATICISWISVIFEVKLLALASPFILYWLYVYFRGDISDINSAFRTRQSFHQNLVASTVNPHDAEAHYQLGLVYQHRRQYTEAIERYKRAVEIDPREIDAHYQLGRIAREQNRLQDAITHFDAVVTQDEKHCRYEIWREIGATYLAASVLEEARKAFERYTVHRPYDPEGLYSYGDTLNKLGEKALAREVFERCVEAVKTMPYYRRGQVSRWRKLSQEQLKGLKTESTTQA